MRTREPSKLSLTATLLFGAGTLVLLSGGAMVADELDALRWPSVTGHVRSSEVTSETARRVHAASGRRVTHTRHTAKVAYEYTVGGQRFVGTQVSTTNIDYLSEEAANAIVARYPTGKATAVYYDPDDASTAILENEMAGAGYRAMGLGTLLVLAAAAMKIASRF